MCYATLAVETFLFLLLDGLFLTVVMRPWFEKQVRLVQGSGIQLDLVSTVLCYLVLLAGLYYFVIRTHRPIHEAMFLGWFVYGVYETTTKSILNKWQWRTVIVDTVWGGILFGLVTAGVYTWEGRKIKFF